jgi:hypothetical protein
LATVLKETLGSRLSYALKNQAFLIVLYSLRFRGVVGVEGRIVDRVDGAIISGCCVVYFSTGCDFNDICLKPMTRETLQPLVMHQMDQMNTLYS